MASDGREHDRATHAAWCFLLRRGYRVAWEVGVVGGRIDIVRLDAADRWVELYEVKLREPKAGIPQILRYASKVEGEPKLTLVVPPAEATRELRAKATASGVTVWSFNWKRYEGIRSLDRGEMVHLPSLSAEAIAHISASNRAWAKTPAAAESRRMFKEQVAA